MRSRDGQAAADYAAVLLVVAAVLALAAADGVPGIGERVVATVRTGLCVVGGDICRDADARAAGLSPCVTSGRERGTETAVSLAVVRVGEDGRWSVAMNSDGSAEVTRTEGRSVGATGGVGITLRPIGLDVGVDGHVGPVRQRASTWRFTRVEAAREFLERALGPDPRAVEQVAPDERWDALGAEAEASVGAEVPGVVRAGGRAAATNVLGRRTGGGRTTWFFRSTIDDPQVFATLPTWSSKGPGREAVLELTHDAGGARELVVRSARSTPDQVEEFTATLDLRDPAIRARVGDGPPWPAPDALIRLAATDGVVERQVHAIDDRSQTFQAEAKLLIALGVEHTRVDVRSRLAEATVWIAGSGPRQRADCLGS